MEYAHTVKYLMCGQEPLCLSILTGSVELKQCSHLHMELQEHPPSLKWH